MAELKIFQKTFVPVFEGLALQKLPVQQTRGGLALPENVGELGQDESSLYIVIAVGLAVKDVSEGDVVLAGNHPMPIVWHKGQDFRITRVDHIAGIVEVDALPENLRQALKQRYKEVPLSNWYTLEYDDKEEDACGVDEDKDVFVGAVTIGQNDPRD